MWTLAWTIVVGLILGFLNMSGLSNWERAGIIGVAGLAGVNAILAARRDAKFIALWARWKLWRARKNHEQQIAEHGETRHVLGAKLDSIERAVVAAGPPYLGLQRVVLELAAEMTRISEIFLARQRDAASEEESIRALDDSLGYYKVTFRARVIHACQQLAVAGVKDDLLSQWSNPPSVPPNIAQLIAERLIVTAGRLNEPAASRAQLPEVSVKLDRIGGSEGGYCLLVVNRGAVATFRANLYVVSSDFGFAGSRHKLWWRLAESVESRIETRGEDHLVFGNIKFDHSIVPTGVTPSLHVSYKRRQPSDLHSYSWILHNEATPPMSAVLEITITAEPEMANGPWVGRIRFGPLDAELLTPISLLSDPDNGADRS